MAIVRIDKSLMRGLSTDVKPRLSAYYYGSKFYETDTRKTFVWELGGWVELTSGTTNTIIGSPSAPSGTTPTLQEVTLKGNSTTKGLVIDKSELSFLGDIEGGRMSLKPESDAIPGQIDVIFRALPGTVAYLSDLDFHAPADGNYYASRNNAWQSFNLPSGLEAINEGNGIGWRLIGRDPNNYIPTGKDSVDLGNYYSDIITGFYTTVSVMHKWNTYQIRTVGSTDFTALGAANNNIGTRFVATTIPGFVNGEGTVYNVNNAHGAGSPGGFNVGTDNSLPAGGGNYGMHITMGANNIIKGYYNNMSFGVVNTTADGYSTFSAGFNNYINAPGLVGQSFTYGLNNRNIDGLNATLGLGLNVHTKGTVVVGEGNADYVSDWVSSNRPMFIVGIGDVSYETRIYGAILNKKDGLIVYKPGQVVAPSLTNSMITAETTGQVLLTRNWFEANSGGGGGGDFVDLTTDQDVDGDKSFLQPLNRETSGEPPIYAHTFDTDLGEFVIRPWSDSANPWQVVGGRAIALAEDDEYNVMGLTKTTTTTSIITFTAAVSTEEDYDYLNLIVDGDYVWDLSGEVGPTEYSVVVYAVGEIDIEFEFSRDGSDGAGTNSVEIYNFLWAEQSEAGNDVLTISDTNHAFVSRLQATPNTAATWLLPVGSGTLGMDWYGWANYEGDMTDPDASSTLTIGDHQALTDLVPMIQIRSGGSTTRGSVRAGTADNFMLANRTEVEITYTVDNEAPMQQWANQFMVRAEGAFITAQNGLTIRLGEPASSYAEIGQVLTAVDETGKAEWRDPISASSVSTSTDTYSAPKAENIITLTVAEHAALAVKDPNTIYITI